MQCETLKMKPPDEKVLKQRFITAGLTAHCRKFPIGTLL